MPEKLVTIYPYVTLKECFLAFLGKKISDEELKNFRWEGFDNGKKYNVNAYRWLKNTKRKCWGWAQYKTKSIHLWVSKECEMEELIGMIAHEVAHLKTPRPKDKRKEERKASRTAQCAEFAYRFATELIERQKR